MAILLAAVSIPFWDPVRLAEEISVLDLISKGRVSYAFGVGHRAEEYEHFGVDMATRGRLADEKLALLGQLVQGEPVDLEAAQSASPRRARQPAGRRCMIAGGSKAAVRARRGTGSGFISQTAAGSEGVLRERSAAPTDTSPD